MEYHAMFKDNTDAREGIAYPQANGLIEFRWYFGGRVCTTIVNETQLMPYADDVMQERMKRVWFKAHALFSDNNC